MPVPDTYCLYCQEEFGTGLKLRRHIEKDHVGTYAYYRVNLEVAKDQTLGQEEEGKEAAG